MTLPEVFNNLKTFKYVSYVDGQEEAVLDLILQQFFIEIRTTTGFYFFDKDNCMRFKFYVRTGTPGITVNMGMAATTSSPVGNAPDDSKNDSNNNCPIVTIDGAGFTPSIKTTSTFGIKDADMQAGLEKKENANWELNKEIPDVDWEMLAEQSTKRLTNEDEYTILKNITKGKE